MIALAIYFHGGELFVLGFLGMVLGTCGLASVWLVKKYKPQMGRRAYWLAVVPFVLLAAAIVVLASVA